MNVIPLPFPLSPQVFSDRDLASDATRSRLEAALGRADIFFGSLLFDYDQVREGREEELEGGGKGKCVCVYDTRVRVDILRAPTLMSFPVLLRFLYRLPLPLTTVVIKFYITTTTTTPAVYFATLLCTNPCNPPPRHTHTRVQHTGGVATGPAGAGACAASV